MFKFTADFSHAGPSFLTSPFLTASGWIWGRIWADFVDLGAHSADLGADLVDFTRVWRRNWVDSVDSVVEFVERC